MNAKRIKATKMWASDNTASDLSCDSELMAHRSQVHRNPLFVLPGDAESYDAILEQAWMAQGMLTHSEVAKQFASIGITKAKK